jgi:EAL domain-containing protein (putative c-di-GMP-specific phosphodiesterase class I)
VRPDDFIPLAEETGTIRLLSRWAIATAAAQAARWRELATRIDELLSGTVSAISEWDESLSEPIGYGWFHRHVVSGSCDSWR